MNWSVICCCRWLLSENDQLVFGEEEYIMRREVLFIKSINLCRTR